MKKLDGKIALVTGATSGIGEATAKLFAQEGAMVICIGRDEKRGNNVVSEINSKTNGNAFFYLCDVSNSSEVNKMYEEVKNKFHKLDILFNNAGIWVTNSLQDICDEEWDEIYAINLNSVMYMTRAFLAMIKENKGTILNNASIGGLQSYVAGAKQYAYASSKAAVIQFSKLCALNHADSIRVNCICPGVTVTPIYVNRDFSRFNDNVPMGRMARAEEIAKAALFLVSDDASYITGACLAVDGGASLM